MEAVGGVSRGWDADADARGAGLPGCRKADEGRRKNGLKTGKSCRKQRKEGNDKNLRVESRHSIEGSAARKNI